MRSEGVVAAVAACVVLGSMACRSSEESPQAPLEPSFAVGSCAVSWTFIGTRTISVAANSTNNYAEWFLKNTGTSSLTLISDTPTKSGTGVAAVRKLGWTNFPFTLPPGQQIDAGVLFDAAASGTGAVGLTVATNCANYSAPNHLVTLQAPPPGTPLPVGVMGYDGVGKGPGNDANGQKWTVLHELANPLTIGNVIAAADAHNVLLVLNFAGQKPQFLVGNVVSMTKYRAQLDRFKTGTPSTQVSPGLADTIADAMARRRVVCYIIDEPNLDSIPPDVVSQMASEHKSRWNCLTLARVTPTLLASGWKGLPRAADNYAKLDYAWSQYNKQAAKNGQTPSQVWKQERDAIALNNLNVGLAVSLNLWAGGISQTTDLQAPCWDYTANGSSGYVLGINEVNETEGRPCGTLPTPVPGVIASPAWIQHFVQKAAADGGFPFVLLWQHATGNNSDTFNVYYTRQDFITGFDNAIQTGLNAQAAPWRTAK